MHTLKRIIRWKEAKLLYDAGLLVDDEGVEWSKSLQIKYDARVEADGYTFRRWWYHHKTNAYVIVEGDSHVQEDQS